MKEPSMVNPPAHKITKTTATTSAPSGMTTQPKTVGNR